MPSQQFNSSVALNQQLPIRNPNPVQNQNPAQPQLIRRPSINATGDNNLLIRQPQPVQRIDSRTTVGPTQIAQQQQQQFVSSVRPIQQQQQLPSSQQSGAPVQYQQRPVITTQQPQIRADNISNIVVNRGPPPNLQQQNQPNLSRAAAPPPSLAQTPQFQSQQQQRLPLNRAPIPSQQPAPNTNLAQYTSQPAPQNPLQNQTIRIQNQPAQLIQNTTSDGVRLSSTPQYRPQLQQSQQPQQIQQPPRQINPSYKLPTHFEEERRGLRMATDINQASTQPSYIISNSDDVDDVIVRPIANLDLKQHQQQSSKPISEPNNATSVLQNSHAASNIPKAAAPPPQQVKQQLVDVGSKLPTAAAKPAAIKKSPTEERNGTNGRSDVSFKNLFHSGKQFFNIEFYWF